MFSEETCWYKHQIERVDPENQANKTNNGEEEVEESESWNLGTSIDEISEIYEEKRSNLRKSIKKLSIKRKKVRRGKRKSCKSFSSSLRFLGVNAAGLRPKLLTFKKILTELKPSVFCIKETKYKDSGKFKLDGYIIYELVRHNRDGGGGLAL